MWLRRVDKFNPYDNPQDGPEEAEMLADEDDSWCEGYIDYEDGENDRRNDYV